MALCAPPRKLSHYRNFDFRGDTFINLPQSLRHHSASTIPPKVKVTLFIPCFVDLMFPRVGISMVQILERLGHTLECPEELACCGQPAFNSGYWEEARSVAANVLSRLKDAEAIVIASGSCGAMLKV